MSSVVETAQFYLDRKDYSPGSDFENICKAIILMDARSRHDSAIITNLELKNQLLELKNQRLRSALERTLQALKNRNLGKPYACLDEVFAEAEHALK